MGILSSILGDRPSTPQTGGFTVGAEIPDELKPFYKDILGKSQALYNESVARGFEPYTGPSLAEFTPEQQQAFTGLSGLQGGTAPVFQEAMQMTRDAAAPITTEQIEEYMNPYQQAVVDIEKREAQKQFESQVVPQLAAKAAMAQPFGGSRQAILEGMAADTQQRLLGDIQAKGSAQAYQDAVNLINNQRTASGQAAGQLATMAPNQFKTQLAEFGALQGVGEEKQKLAQQALNEAYGQYLKEQEYPYQQLGRYQSVVTGAPISTREYIPPVEQPSATNQLLGGLGTLASTYGAFGGFSPGGFMGMNKPAKTGGGIKDLPVIKRQATGKVMPKWLQGIMKIVGPDSKYDAFVKNVGQKVVIPQISKIQDYELGDAGRNIQKAYNYLNRPEVDSQSLMEIGGNREEILQANKPLTGLQADFQKFLKVGKEAGLDAIDIPANIANKILKYTTGKNYIAPGESGRSALGIDSPDLTISEQFYPATSAEIEGEGIAGSVRKSLEGSPIEGMLSTTNNVNKEEPPEVTDNFIKPEVNLEERKEQEKKFLQERADRLTAEKEKAKRKKEAAETPDDIKKAQEEVEKIENKIIALTGSKEARLTKRLKDLDVSEREAQFGNLAMFFTQLAKSPGTPLSAIISSAEKVLPTALKTKKEFKSDRNRLEDSIEDAVLGKLTTEADIKKARLKIKTTANKLRFERAIALREIAVKEQRAAAEMLEARGIKIGNIPNPTKSTLELTGKTMDRVLFNGDIKQIKKSPIYNELLQVTLSGNKKLNDNNIGNFIEAITNDQVAQAYVYNEVETAEEIARQTGNTNFDRNRAYAAAIKKLIQEQPDIYQAGWFDWVRK